MIRTVRKGVINMDALRPMTDAQYAAAVDNSPHITDARALRCKSSAVFNITPNKARASQKLRGFYDERNDLRFGCVIFR